MLKLTQSLVRTTPIGDSKAQIRTDNRVGLNLLGNILPFARYPATRVRLQVLGASALSGQSGAESTVPGGVAGLYMSNPLEEIGTAKRELGNNEMNNRRLDAVPVGFAVVEGPGGVRQHVTLNGGLGLPSLAALVLGSLMTGMCFP